MAQKKAKKSVRSKISSRDLKTSASTNTKSKKVADTSTIIGSLLSQVKTKLQIEQNYISFILGLLIVLSVGVLAFNYIKKHQPATLGPAQQTVMDQTQPTQDVSSENLPGKYTVKSEDTLFLIAVRYYNDGYKFTEIAKANNLPDANIIEVGQELYIPKLETQSTASVVKNENEGIGGSANVTTWGDKITSEKYVVQEGDWLSTIAGRAYGDVMQFEKIAKANGISDPNDIEPGKTIQIPR